MQKSSLIICVLSVMLCGCIGDQFAERTLLLEQPRTDQVSGKRFKIDVSRLPPDWIYERTVEPIRNASEADHIRLNPLHSVKVILVPEDKRG